MTGSGEGTGSEETVRVARGDPWLGRVLKNKYQLERLLGAGGFGAVYAARQLLMGTWHAVKLLHGPSGTQPELVERFREEARIGTQLRHPRIVTVTDFDVEDGTFFLVMDFIESVTLAQRLGQAPGDAGRQIEPWARDIAAALDYAHAQRVIHRDLKPSNILIREQDQAALLTDFGISRWLSSVGVTQAGTTLGTYAYMSPQQCAGEERAIDSRSDIYSFAALLFELECGRPPFGTGQAAMHAHLHQPVPPVRQFRPDHPHADQLDAVFARGLAKSPNQRPQSAEELVEAFVDARAGVMTQTMSVPKPSPPLATESPSPAPKTVPRPPPDATPPPAPEPPPSLSAAHPPAPVLMATAVVPSTAPAVTTATPPPADSLPVPAVPARTRRISPITQLPVGIRIAAVGAIGLVISFFLPLTSIGDYSPRPLVRGVIEPFSFSWGALLVAAVLVALACFLGWQSMASKRGWVALVLAVGAYLVAALTITSVPSVNPLIPMAIILAAVAVFLAWQGAGGTRTWIGLLLSALVALRQLLLVIGPLIEHPYDPYLRTRETPGVGLYVMGAGILAILFGAVIEILESRRRHREIALS